ncbi:MAG: hypothetical protein KKC75_01555 [Nanoarchaeota archaeon]|nr:hypothetical protein [Nanoarchaeota archaeon]MBU1004760.1 hypothetical protein [Nanoarchaeota archaeon]MBU1946619.1 hypothetical protein [Nanoarchaeota archaeon]
MSSVEFKRKLYKRGSSFETTIPMPLLFALDKEKKYNVVFLFDSEANKWYIQFEDTSKKSIEDEVKKNA